MTLPILLIIFSTAAIFALVMVRLGIGAETVLLIPSPEIREAAERKEA